jgi:hypothetical protein
MTKRQAILAGLAATVGLMSGRAKAEMTAPAVQTFSITQQPQNVTFSLDTFKSFTFTQGGESVTVTGKEIFDALKST